MTEVTGDALKSCPFCGGEADLDDHSTSYRKDAKPLYAVTCLNNDCASDLAFIGEDKAKVIKGWNTRTPPVSMDEVEALKHDLDRARATANELATENVALIEAMLPIFAELDNGASGPGHAHTLLGVWDIDIGNGAKAGRPCEWCAQWSNARALLTRIKEPSK